MSRPRRPDPPRVGRDLTGTPVDRLLRAPLLFFEHRGRAEVFDDGESAADPEAWARRLRLAGCAAVLRGDGMAVLLGRATAAAVDPFDPHARAPGGGSSALELAGRLAAAAVLYGYGYDRPDERAWALRALADAAPGR